MKYSLMTDYGDELNPLRLEIERIYKDEDYSEVGTTLNQVCRLGLPVWVQKMNDKSKINPKELYEIYKKG